MDEVDKIIIHSLEQIGCKLNSDHNANDPSLEDGHQDRAEDVFCLRQFTSHLLVHAVSKCLKEINLAARDQRSLPERETETEPPPQSLPENMAQRFTVATKLAEMCKSIGYRSDIGYQTFLYPNEMETRRLLMFLIEHLPKKSTEQLYLDNGKATIGGDGGGGESTSLSKLLKTIKRNIRRDLKSPWLPPPCTGKQSINNINKDFQPQLSSAIMNYECFRLPAPWNSGDSEMELDIGQQLYRHSKTQFEEGKAYNLISTLLHENALNKYKKFNIDECFRKGTELTMNDELSNITLTRNENNHMQQKMMMSHLESWREVDQQLNRTNMVNRTDQILQQIELFKEQNESLIEKRRNEFSRLNSIKEKRKMIADLMIRLGQKVKTYQRICTILENVDENTMKLERLIENTQKRHLTLELQWKQHRELALKKLEELHLMKQSKNLHIIEELREKIQLLKNNLEKMNSRYMKLAGELRMSRTTTTGGSTKILLRHDYTQRIHEFIGNIRKQRNDIQKIIDDTTHLQKHLNTLEGQLQRQFNYTDDLLFQGAKYDTYAKQAYKILATLHESCKDIYKLIDQIGQLVKEIREQQLKIDRGSAKNIGDNLRQISIDIVNIQNCIELMTNEITNICQLQE